MEIRKINNAVTVFVLTKCTAKQQKQIFNQADTKNMIRYNRGRIRYLSRRWWEWEAEKVSLRQ